MQVYRMSKGWAWFIYIGGGLMLPLFASMLVMPFFSDDSSPELLYFMVPLSLGMIAFLIVGLRDTYRGRLEIHDDHFKQYTALREKELAFTEVAGFREIHNYLLIEPIDKEKRRLKISTYYGNLDKLLLWLGENFDDLDLVQYQREKQQILSDESLGIDSQERAQKLAEAGWVSKILNGIGLAVGLWLFFYPTPYEWAFWAGIAVPLLALVTLFIYRGIVRFDELGKTAHPSLFVAMVMPSLGLGLRAFLDFDILDYNAVWLPMIGIGLGFSAIIAWATREFDFAKARDYLKLFGIGLFFVAYGYGALIILNCYYDNQTPELYETTVLDQRISDSRNSTTYYLEVVPWKEGMSEEEVEVTEDVFSGVQAGDQVGIYEWSGRLGIPWRFVDILY